MVPVCRVHQLKNGVNVSIRGKAWKMFSFLGIQQGSKIDCFLCRLQWLKFEKIVSTYHNYYWSFCCNLSCKALTCLPIPTSLLLQESYFCHCEEEKRMYISMLLSDWSIHIRWSAAIYATLWRLEQSITRLYIGVAQPLQSRTSLHT